MIGSFADRDTRRLWRREAVPRYDPRIMRTALRKLAILDAATHEEVADMEKLTPIHPGEVLMDDFIAPLGITQHRLAVAIGVPPRRINEIVHGQRRISADTALRLGCYFGTSAQFWINLQSHHDLEVERDALGDALDAIHPLRSA